MKYLLGAVAAFTLFSGFVIAADLTSAQRNYVKAAFPNTELADRISDTLDKTSAMVGSVTYTQAAESGTLIKISGQLNDVRGSALAVRGTLVCYTSSDANGDALVATFESFRASVDGTGGSGDGQALVLGTNALLVVSESDGDFDIDYQESSTTDYYLCCQLPNGLTSCSSIIDFD